MCNLWVTTFFLKMQNKPKLGERFSHKHFNHEVHQSHNFPINLTQLQLQRFYVQVLPFNCSHGSLAVSWIYPPKFFSIQQASFRSHDGHKCGTDWLQY